jgi:hypothetical protein
MRKRLVPDRRHAFQLVLTEAVVALAEITGRIKRRRAKYSRARGDSQQVDDALGKLAEATALIRQAMAEGR